MNSFNSGWLPWKVSVRPREVVYHLCEQYSKEPLAKQTIRCGIVPLAKSDRCNNNPGIAISDWTPVHNYYKFNRKKHFFGSLKVEYPQGFFHLKPSSELKRMTSHRTSSLNQWSFTHTRTNHIQILTINFYLFLPLNYILIFLFLNSINCVNYLHFFRIAERNIADGGIEIQLGMQIWTTSKKNISLQNCKLKDASSSWCGNIFQTAHVLWEVSWDIFSGGNCQKNIILTLMRNPKNVCRLTLLRQLPCSVFIARLCNAMLKKNQF